MKTRNVKRKVLADSSDDTDHSDKKSAKPRKSCSDSMYSTEDSSHSRTDTTGVPEEDEFSQLKTKSSKRSKRARRPPDVSSDSDDDSDSPKRPRNPSDSQYSSEDAVNSPKKRAGLKRQIESSSSDESDAPQIQTRSARGRKKKRQPARVQSEEDSISQAESDGSKTEELSDSSSSSGQSDSVSQADSSQLEESNDPTQSTEESDSVILVESDSSHTDESNEPSQATQEEDVSPKKYKNLRVGSDSEEEEDGEKQKLLKGEKKQKLPKESPKKVANLHLLEHIFKELYNKIHWAKPNVIHDIIFGNPIDLILPKFSELLWQVVINNKSPEIASDLVRAGVNVNLVGPDEYSRTTVLHVVAEKASRKGYEGLAFTLMFHGANINARDGDENTVLHSAVKGGSVTVIEELLRRGVDLGKRYNQVLRVAAERADNAAKILPLLVEYKADDMETKDERAMQALRCLVENGSDLVAMRILLDYILPLDELDDFGHSVLHRAVIDCKVEMVKLLLEYGANPRKKRRDGTLPLWHAARQPTSVITRLLIKYGANINDCNDDGYYPIHGACNLESLENIRLLLHLGAEINQTDSYDIWTPFGTIKKFTLTDANRLMIQHFALLTSKNVKFHPRDLKKIREFSNLRKYYTQCLSELEKMKRLIIFEDISVHCLLKYDIAKISSVIKNSELIDRYHESLRGINSKYPILSTVIRKRMKIAWGRRDKLTLIENALMEATNNVLTADVCEKIAYLACYDSLIDFELKEIAS